MIYVSGLFVAVTRLLFNFRHTSVETQTYGFLLHV